MESYIDSVMINCITNRRSFRVAGARFRPILGGNKNFQDEIGRRTALCFGLLCIIASGGCASNPGNARLVGEPTIAELDGSRTQLEVNRFVGQVPDRCSPSRTGYEVCVYILGKYNRIWLLQSQSLRTHRKVNLICEFESGRGQGGSGDCDVYIREAKSFEPSRQALADKRMASADDSRRQIALDLLDSKRTIMEISDFVGDAPAVCGRDGKLLYRCEWRAGNDARGYQVLASIAKTSRRVLLLCSLPRDGSPRAEGSCTVTGA